MGSASRTTVPLFQASQDGSTDAERKRDSVDNRSCFARGGPATRLGGGLAAGPASAETGRRAGVAVPVKQEGLRGQRLRQEAWERGMRCKEYASETFRRDPAGSQTRPVEPGQRPEARLAWHGGATHPTKRKQPVLMACE